MGASIQDREGTAFLIDGDFNVNIAGIQLEMEWNGRSKRGEEVASRIYFYRIKAW